VRIQLCSTLANFCLVIVGTFAQALSGSGPAVGIVGAIIVWRFIMGIGIGGDVSYS
jgi:PHS family inorganic phosphate transporter-like MFS transporter